METKRPKTISNYYCHYIIKYLLNVISFITRTGYNFWVNECTQLRFSENRLITDVGF